MLNNTYDASSLNFGILVSKDFPNIDDSIFLINNENNLNAVNNAITMEGTSFLDFKYVDGLTLNQILSCQNINFKSTIIFVAYNTMKLNTVSIEKIENNSYNYVLYYIIISTDNNRGNERIDEVIERVMLNNYKNKDNDIKRIMKCFLERHRYGSKEETDAKIKEYTKKY